MSTSSLLMSAAVGAAVGFAIVLLLFAVGSMGKAFVEGFMKGWNDG